MTVNQTSVLQAKSLNSWRLFALVLTPMCVAVLVKMAAVDLASPQGVSAMITYSVRLAVPWLFIAFAASSIAALFPGQSSRWLLRNRRIIGLCFAAGMAWQLLFIVWLLTGHFGYYMEEAYSYFSLAEQVPGYILLIAMTITSFRFGRNLLSPRQWRLLHKGGIYFLWGVLFSTYWYELFYYDDIQAIDYVYYWMGFAAWGVRVLAWAKKARGKIKKQVPQPAT